MAGFDLPERYGANTNLRIIRQIGQSFQNIGVSVEVSRDVIVVEKIALHAPPLSCPYPLQERPGGRVLIGRR